MNATFVLKIYCFPPDINRDNPESIDLLLHTCEHEIRRLSFIQCGDIPVGISLVADVSDYRIGDMIWAEGEFRGDPAVRAIPWSLLDQIAESLAKEIFKNIFDFVNNEERLKRDKKYVSCHYIGVTIGSENGPVTATRHSKIN